MQFLECCIGRNALQLMRLLCCIKSRKTSHGLELEEASTEDVSPKACLSDRHFRTSANL